MSALDATFGALADPTRRGVIDLLRREPHRASEIAAALDMSRPAMSRHLRVLRESGLVEATGHEDARVRVYSLRKQRFAELRDWLDDVDQFWTAQLDGFAEHVRKKHGRRR